MTFLRGLLLGALLTPGAWAQSAPEAARAASAELERAAIALDAAGTALDRVSALTDVVRAYEDGLAALRLGLRNVTVQERTLARDLEARQDRLSRLLAVLQRMERLPSTLLLAHPSGALDTARASMLLSDGLPALEAEAAELRADLATLAALRAAQTAAATDLTAGLSGIASARLALSEAIADRTALPRPLAEDPAAAEALAARVATLDAFAEGLSELPRVRPAPVSGPFDLPVRGDLIRAFGAADASGTARPGIILETETQALLTATVTGTIRYAGPLLDYGNVIMQEPRPGLLLVFAGLRDVYVSSGEIATRGAALGMMGGSALETEEIRPQGRATTGALRSEALYVEVREAGRPVDPATWFAME
ncbi:MAG: peptidoglycan DD-metalloendopeptidase family protein [Pseudomonadota bacterium]